jgi:hypothetical protein
MLGWRASSGAVVVPGAPASLGNGGAILVHPSSINLVAALNVFGEYLQSEYVKTCNSKCCSILNFSLNLHPKE